MSEVNRESRAETMPDEVEANVEESHARVDVLATEVSADEAKAKEAIMIEPHAPHHAVTTWKDVFIHIGIVSVGLLIAIGLEQTVEFFHHRHQVAEMRRALNAERLVNIHYFAAETDEIHRILPLLRGNLAVYQYLRKHPGAPKNQWPGDIHWYGMYPRYVNAVWKNAEQNDVLRYMPNAEVRELSNLYDLLTLLTDANQAAKTTKRELFINSIEEADPGKLTATQLDEQIHLTAQLIRDYSNCANEEENINRQHPDFTPAPSTSEFYQIANIAIDKHDYEVVHDEMKRMRSLDSLEETDQRAGQGGSAEKK